jgi:ADP-ribose pyrophosphatase
LPNGRTAHYEVARHPGGAAVVALDGEGRVCLLRQYRHPMADWLWELPAGKLDVEGEAPRATALRELEEEAGVSAAACVDLGRFISTPGFCDEVIYLYFATELAPVPTNHSEGEVIEIHWVAFAEAVQMARSGQIEDGKTVAGLFRAEPLVKDMELEG